MGYGRQLSLSFFSFFSALSCGLGLISVLLEKYWGYVTYPSLDGLMFTVFLPFFFTSTASRRSMVPRTER